MSQGQRFGTVASVWRRDRTGQLTGAGVAFADDLEGVGWTDANWTDDAEGEERPIGRAADPLAALTPKQREVLDLLIEHKTSKEISRQLGISPHTVDQRIMFARSKLNVATRGEVAQAYRRLLSERRNSADQAIYERLVCENSHIAEPAPAVHHSGREAVAAAALDVRRRWDGLGQPSLPGPGRAPDGEIYYHVLPEMFDGPYGTVLRLGVIALVAAFLILVVMGGLAMFVQLSAMIDH